MRSLIQAAQADSAESFLVNLNDFGNFLPLALPDKSCYFGGVLESDRFFFK